MVNLSKQNIIITSLILVVLLGVLSAPAIGQSSSDGVDITDRSVMDLKNLGGDVKTIDINDSDSVLGKDGRLRYSIEITGKVYTNNYPILYPIRVNYYDVTESSSTHSSSDLLNGPPEDVVKIGSSSVFLTPTNPKSFPPGNNPSGEYDTRQMSRNYNTTLNFEDLSEIGENDVETKEVAFVLESTRSTNVANTKSTDDIKGPLPAGASQSFVSQQSKTDIPSTVSFPKSYRISEQRANPQFGEDLSIPSPSNGDLKGDMEGFSSMTKSLEGISTVSGSNGINFNTLTSSIPTASPQTLVVTYNITKGDEITMTPINPAGQEIVEPTNYVLPRDAGDSSNCRQISIGATESNACIFYLDQGEIDSINNLGELVINYKTDTETEVAMGCQSLISGYLPIDAEACGVNPFGGDEGEQDPLLSLVLEGQSGDKSNLQERSWETDTVNVPSRQGVDEEDHHVRWDVIGNIDEDDYSDDVEIHIFDDSQLEFKDGSKTVKSGETPLHSAEIGNFNRNDENIKKEIGQAPTIEVTEYTAILCGQDGSNVNTVPSDCGVSERSNIASDNVKFVPPEIDGELIINEPVTIDPLEIKSEGQFQSGTKRIQTIDDNYDSNSGWQKINNDDPIIEDYDGTITQVVSLEDRSQSDAEDARNGVIIQDARDRLADVPDPNRWDAEASVSQSASGERYIPETANPAVYNMGNWDGSVTNYNTRQVEYVDERESFPLVTDASFASQVESQERWYPLRNRGTGVRSSTTYTLDSVLRTTDPDGCINCLPTETSSQAASRLQQSIGGITRVIQTPNGDPWNKVDDEAIIRSGEVTGSTLYRRETVVGNTLFYENIGPSSAGIPDDKKYRMRQTSRSNKNLFEWEYSPEILEVPFEKPVTEPTTRYVNNRYDISYTFRYDVQTEADLYEYEKPVYEPDIEYKKGHVAWLDISQSDSEEFYQYEVQYEGADNPVTVRWDEDIHGVPPHDRNEEGLNSICDGSVTNFDGDQPVTMGGVDVDDSSNNLEYADGRHGEGGKVVLQTCQIDGEKRIVRVGMEYTEPGTYTFDVDVTGLSGDDGEGTGANNVIPETEDDEILEETPKSSPEIGEIEPVNEKVDYRVGTVAFKGQVTSSTHHLDELYEITVTPADNIEAGSVSCDEFSGYNKNRDTELTQSFVTGESFRQVDRCVRTGFEEPKEAPDSFKTLRIGYTEGTNDQASSDFQTAFGVPEGAIQECRSPLQQDNGDCYIQNDMIDPNDNGDRHIIDFGTSGSWESVDRYNSDIPALGSDCPHGYQSETNRITDNSTYDLIIETRCVQDGELNIDLRSRLVSIEYESITPSVVRDCTNIAIVGEDGSHAGYENTGSDNTERKCQKKQSSDPGPSSFTLYDDFNDPVTNPNEDSFEEVPAGAFRGSSLTMDQDPSQCESTRIEDDGTLICEFENSAGDVQEVRYGVRDTGSWTSTSQDISNMVDQSQSRKSVWRGNYVVPKLSNQIDWNDNINEQFTAVINPRNIGVSLNSLEDNEVEFTFELREVRTSDVVAEETATVKLCKAESVGTVEQLPRSTIGENECDNFDSVLTGYDDWQVDGNNPGGSAEAVPDLDAAVSNYAENGISNHGPEDYLIESVANDACPYTHKFPRDQKSLVENPETYTIDADSASELNDEEERIREKIVNELGGQYSTNGDPCSGSVADYSPPTPVSGTQDINITFGKTSLLLGVENHDSAGRSFTRLAGLSDLHQNNINPVQSRWSQDDLGGGVRLGTPILLDQKYKSGAGGATQAEKNQVNEDLIAHYAFDHDPTEHVTFTTYPGGTASNGDTVETIPNHFVVQDVGFTETRTAPDGTERNWNADEISSHGSKGTYNARLWHGTPCHEGPDGVDTGSTTNGKNFNPQTLQPISSQTPKINRDHISEGRCYTMFKSGSSQVNDISQYDYVANPKYSDYSGSLPNEFELNSIGSSRDIQRLKQSVPDGQSAYLPVEPITTGPTGSAYDVDTGTNTITNAYKSVQDNYMEGQGIFGGNALRLEPDSWLMVTPPCYDRDNLGKDSVVVENGAGIGILERENSCKPGNDPDSSEAWRGGWATSYTDKSEQLVFSSIHENIGDEYTVSFWVNTEDGRTSDDVDKDDAGKVAPVDTIYSTSKPVIDDEIGTANAMMTTNGLATLRVPQEIDVSDLDNSDIPGVATGESSATPVAWDYPTHFNLLDTARSCMSLGDLDIVPSVGPGAGFDISSTSLDQPGQRPVMCEIYEEAKDTDLTQYDSDNLDGKDRPPYLEEFRQEIIERIDWEYRYDWAPGPSIEPYSNEPANYPAYGSDNNYVDQGFLGDGCNFATQKDCYNNGRYIYGSGSVSELGPHQSNDEYGASGWQHVAISRDSDSVDLYVNGEVVETPTRTNSDGKIKTDSDFFENAEIPVGKLYDDGVISIGTMYQGAGYGFNPNDPGGDSKYIPYIHASESNVMIDELRVYNDTADQSPVGEHKIDNEVPELKTPNQHGLDSDASMYTGTFEMDKYVNVGENASLLTELGSLPGQARFNTWEFTVNAGSEGPAAYEVEIIPCEESSSTCAEDASVSISDSQIPDGLSGRGNPSDIPSGPVYIDPMSPGDSDDEDIADYDRIHEESEDFSLGSKAEAIKFDSTEISEAGMSRIDSFKFNIKLGTPFLDSTPVIRSIEAEPKPSPYSDCQSIAQNHPGADGLYGSKFTVKTIDKSTRLAETECDMRTAGGNWTKFAWVDQSENGEFTKDVSNVDSLFTDQVNRADCDLDDDNVCFASADYSLESLEGENPQLLIKSVNEGETSNWATFELDPDVHDVIETNLGTENVKVADTTANIFSGADNSDLVKDTNGPYQMSGQDPSKAVGILSTRMDQNPFRDRQESQDKKLYRKCIHPFDNSDNFDQRCFSHVHSDPDGSNIDSTSHTSVRLTEMSQTSSGGGNINVREEDILHLAVDLDQKKIEELNCLGENAERCEFYYRHGESGDPFSEDSSLRQSATFDPDDYDAGNVPDVQDGNFARGYTFNLAYDTRITSLYSAYKNGNSNDWFVALYESDDNGNLGNKVVSTSASSSTTRQGFEENNIPNKELEAGKNYTIVQGKDTDSDPGKHIGWNGPGFNMPSLIGENPFGIFRPAQNGQAYIYQPDTATGLQQTNHYAESDRTPRVGFDYEITDTQFQAAQGAVINLELNRNSLESGTVGGYTVTNTISGADVTSQSTITAPTGDTNLETPNGLQTNFDQCDSGSMEVEASWQDSEGQTYTDTATLEVTEPPSCPTWVDDNQELVADYNPDGVATLPNVRGFKIRPNQDIRIDRLGLGYGPSVDGGTGAGLYDGSKLKAWAAVYSVSNGNTPGSVLAKTVKDAGSNDKDLDYYDLENNDQVTLDAGQKYIIAVGGSVSVQRPSGSLIEGRAKTYILKKGPLAPALWSSPDINWGNVENLDVTNNNALFWDVTDPTGVGSSASSPSYLVNRAPTESDEEFPPNIGIDYEYLIP